MLTDQYNTHFKMKRVEITIRDQSLALLAEKMAYWKEAKTLLVADTHFGKAATFRKAGIPVPCGTTEVMLARLSQTIGSCQAERLIVLGDFVHSATRCQNGFEADLIAWRAQLPALEMILVRGNHDRGHDTLFKALAMKIVSEPFAEPPFAFCHFHDVDDESENRNENQVNTLSTTTNQLFRFGGHIHPGVTLQDFGKAKEKIPCFWISDSFMVLPAFGEFTGCATVRPGTDDQVFAIADQQVMDATLLVNSTKE